MNTQQLHTDKLDLIGWIYSLQDISLIEKLKEIQNHKIIHSYESSLKPMSEKELINKVIIANKSIDNKDVISQDELRKEIENW